MHIKQITHLLPALKLRTHTIIIHADVSQKGKLHFIDEGDTKTQ